jgi:hypothetical protein
MVRQILVSAFVVVVALAGYHLALRPTPARGGASQEDLAALARRLDALEEAIRSAAPPRLSGSAESAAPTAVTPTPEAAPPAPPPTRTVTASPPMSQEEAEHARAADALTHFRARVRAAGPTLTEAAVDQAATLLAAHAEALRLLQMEIASASPAERGDLARREEGLRTDLDAALAEVLPAQVREALGPPKRPR